jgi:hypothetical protein
MAQPLQKKERLTFSSLLKRWEAAELPTLKTSTANHYQYVLNNKVLEYFAYKLFSAWFLIALSMPAKIIA